MTRFALLPIALVLVGCAAEIPGETRREQQAIELDGSKSTRVNLEMNAGELKVSGGATKLMEAEFTYNVDRLKPVVEHRPNPTGSEIHISHGNTQGFTFGNNMSRWDLRAERRCAVGRRR